MILPDRATLTLFLITSLVILVTPGPAVLYILARSLEGGRLAGLVSAAGLSCGGLVHVAAAATGLSAILLSSTTAFRFVRFAGAGYLVYLGLRTLLTPGPVMQTREGAPGDLATVFRQGVLVNLLNPKAAVFFLAFLPQFVDPSRGSVPQQFLVLGFLFTTIGAGTDCMYALVAGTLGNWLRGHASVVRGQRLVAGMVYIVLGLVAALGPAD